VSDYQFFTYEVPRPHVAWVTINREERSNSIHPPAHLEWSKICDRIEADDDIWMAVFTGAGDRAFCATRFIDRHDFPKPVIARVNGAAVGGGFEVALACDLVVASTTATFALTEVLRGLYAGGGGVHRLPRQMPMKLAMEYLMTGKRMTADEALHWGLINRVAEPAVLDAEVNALIDELMAAAPLSLRATKQAAMRGLDRPLADALYDEYPAVTALFSSEDVKEGPLAFAEKRPPNWQGR